MCARTKPLLDLVLCGLAFIPCTHVVALQAKDSQAAPFKIEVKVNKVLVPVVVRDAERRAVGNLKKEDFQVFDQDQLQIVSGFSIEKRGLGETDTRSGTSSPATPNTAPPSSSVPQGFIVFLFDDLHLAADQLGQIRDHVSSLPCVLSDILERAGARANELYDSLESFSAQERIEYQASDHMGYLQDARTGTFDYVVLFEQTAGGTTVQESRKPKHGSHLVAVFSQDVGLPEMALMFLPEIQDNYEMSCEGTGEWNRQRTQVVHLVQRKDKPNHTLSFRDSDGAAHPARLKGRAWIAADSGEVLHMETSLMEEIPAAKVRHWYLSVDCAPVRFHSENVRMLLPQAVDAYYDFEDHRTIAYHTFTDFILFSVQTAQAIQRPKNP
ncbi:MAG TPA: hypothetical protein VMQ17_19125 [Candidatus Sulfotelmatobacter sp.]|nr:hypothetical protein [Candidatus Sulfotelmatobacter sp.]